MSLQLKQAQRKRAKLKIGLSAPSGGGKTMSALLMAYGIVKGEHPEWDDEQIWGKIAIVDSENGSGELYVGREINGFRIGIYNTIPITPPFTANEYIEGMELCKSSGMEVCILDSTSHLWAGTGGMLDKQGAIAKRTGNSYTAWRDVTPDHNRFVDTMLQTDMHIIATMRSKTEYVQEKDSKGKTTVRKVGLAPIQKDGMEYEFTLFLDIDAEHTAFGSKDRTGIVDQQYFTITPKTGLELAHWLDGGAVVATVVPTEIHKAEQPDSKETDSIEIASVISDIDSLARQLSDSGVDSKLIADSIKKHNEINGRKNANYNSIKDIVIAKKVLDELKLLINDESKGE